MLICVQTAEAMYHSRFSLTVDNENNQIETELRSQLRPEVFQDFTARYKSEPRGLFHCSNGLVLAPSLVDEVTLIVKLCNHYKVPIIPFGGGTGLVGGQIYQGDRKPVIVSFHKMTKIRQVCGIENIITAEAGCTLELLQTEAANNNRVFPLSIVSKGSCQIGGNLATNAGGIHVIRYGNMRDLCLGIEAVLPTGKVLNGLSTLRKNNLGLDLKSLLIGSEGILGLITAATLKLFHKNRSISIAMLGLNGLPEAIRLLELFQNHFGQWISAFELISQTSFDFLLADGFIDRHPFKKPTKWYVLVELGTESEINLDDKLINGVTLAQDQGIIVDGIFANSEKQRINLWRIRENIPEANRHKGSVVSNDISIPIASIPEFMTRTNRQLDQIGGLIINCFGHLGDGNLHYNVFAKEQQSTHYSESTKVKIRTIINDNVDSLSGSIAAEHGTGRLHSSYLHNHGDRAMVESIRTIKAGLDPNNIMNPGAIISFND